MIELLVGYIFVSAIKDINDKVKKNQEKNKKSQKRGK
jgi:hypothetical protein